MTSPDGLTAENLRPNQPGRTAAEYDGDDAQFKPLQRDERDDGGPDREDVYLRHAICADRKKHLQPKPYREVQHDSDDGRGHRFERAAEPRVFVQLLDVRRTEKNPQETW